MGDHQASPGLGTEVLFRRIIETSNEGVWVLDAEGGTTFANAKMAELLGYSIDEMAGLSLYDVLDGPGRAQAAANLELRRQGHSAQLECSYLRRDGSAIWVLLNASPLFDDAGGYAGSVSLVSEISARKVIEDALRLREQQLGEAQRVAHLGSWEWDIAADVVTWSDELYRIFGLEPQALDATFSGYLQHVHPDDREASNERIGAALSGASPLEFANRILRPDGEVRWMGARGEVIRGPDGTPLVMRGTALDITDSKRAEAALEEAASRYRLLQVIASTANEAATVEEALQLAVDEICADTSWPVGHVYLPAPGDPGLLVSSDIWHLAKDTPFAGQRAASAGGSFRAGQGLVGQVMAERIPLWVSGEGGMHLAIPVQLGRATAAVLEFFSIGSGEPCPSMMNVLVNIGTQLGRVVEREQARAELAAARDAAVDSSRLKSEFLATMSHEIRTPMNGVIGLTGLLLDTPLDEQQRQYAVGVHSAGEALLAIINDILDFSKIEAGKMELEIVDFDLVQMVEEAAALLAETAQRKGLELLAYCAPELPVALRGDPARLRQVLLNLASNAVKFTERGEVIVRARLAGGPGDAVVVRFEVIDTGIGIDAADHQRLFEPFSQADASTTRRFGGTGLGLAISRRLVSALGGELGFDSEPGVGSTFWFTVPLARSADATVIRSQPFQHLLHGRRVLVVDDNDTNRVILREQLAAWDMLPTLAPDGPGALSLLRAAALRGAPYDLALLDVCMAGMDGLQLARLIASDPALAATRSVLLTSAADVGAEEAREAGALARLTKPVRLSQLYDCLMRLTAPVAGGDALPEAGAVEPAATTRARVLVVEDNAINQMVAVGILRQLGYPADVATNGLEALAALADQDYAAVLMDCQMPEMDGYTATTELRSHPGRSQHLPVIAMTAGAIDGDRERCLAAGMDDYISKPFTPEQVEAALLRWLPEAPARAASHPGPADVGLDLHRLDVLRRMAPADPTLLPRLVTAFLSEAPLTAAALSEAVNAGDAPALRQCAHKLRGAAANLGATSLAALCLELEEQGHKGELEQAPQLLAGLSAELGRSAAALRAAAVPVL